MSRLLTILILSSIISLGLGIMASIDNTREGTIYAICNQARISPEINGKECGNLQDKWHMEFICAQANTSSNNTCWVEDK